MVITVLQLYVIHKNIYINYMFEDKDSFCSWKHFSIYNFNIFFDRKINLVGTFEDQN